MFGWPILRILPFVTLLHYLIAFVTLGKSDIIVDDFDSRIGFPKFWDYVAHIRAPPQEPEDLPRPILISCECPDLDAILAEIAELKQNILLLNYINSFNSFQSNKFELLENQPAGLNLAYYDVIMESPIQFTSVEVASYEECQALCIVSTECNTMSVENTLDGNLVCKISPESITDMVLTPSPYGVTLAKQTTDDYLGENGVFYSLDRNERNFEHLVAFCESEFPNGRLVMPKTELDMASLLAFENSEGYGDTHRFTIYLENDENGNKVWGDGTPFFDTEVGQTYPITEVDGNGLYEVFGVGGENIIRGRDGDTISYAICERNPCP